MPGRRRSGLWFLAGSLRRGGHCHRQYDFTRPSPFQDRRDQRSWWWLSIMGRMKPGISKDPLNARLEVLSPGVFAGALPQDWEPDDQKQFLTRTVVATPAATGTSYLRRKFGEPLNILMAVVGLVLLITCA